MDPDTQSKVELDVFVESGRTHHCCLERTATVADIKFHLYNAEPNHPTNTQNIMHGGILLHDSQTLEDACIYDGVTLCMIRDPPLPSASKRCASPDTGLTNAPGTCQNSWNPDLHKERSLQQQPQQQQQQQLQMLLVDEEKWQKLRSEEVQKKLAKVMGKGWLGGIPLKYLHGQFMQPPQHAHWRSMHQPAPTQHLFAAILELAERFKDRNYVPKSAPLMCPIATPQPSAEWVAATNSLLATAQNILYKQDLSNPLSNSLKTQLVESSTERSSCGGSTSSAGSSSGVASQAPATRRTPTPPSAATAQGTPGSDLAQHSAVVIASLAELIHQCLHPMEDIPFLLDDAMSVLTASPTAFRLLQQQQSQAAEMLADVSQLSQARTRIVTPNLPVPGEPHEMLSQKESMALSLHHTVAELEARAGLLVEIGRGITVVAKFLTGDSGPLVIAGAVVGMDKPFPMVVSSARKAVPAHRTQPAKGLSTTQKTASQLTASQQVATLQPTTLPPTPQQPITRQAITQLPITQRAATQQPTAPLTATQQIATRQAAPLLPAQPSRPSPVTAQRLRPQSTQQPGRLPATQMSQSYQQQAQPQQRRQQPVHDQRFQQEEQRQQEQRLQDLRQQEQSRREQRQHELQQQEQQQQQPLLQHHQPPPGPHRPPGLHQPTHQYQPLQREQQLQPLHSQQACPSPPPLPQTGSLNTDQRHRARTGHQRPRLPSNSHQQVNTAVHHVQPTVVQPHRAAIKEIENDMEDEFDD